MNDGNIVSVSELNEYLKNVFDAMPRLDGIYVRGELSNYKVYPSGHHYFTMKDAGGALRCVLFRSSAARLRFRPADGMKVIATGRVSVYPRDGAYQLYVNSLTPDGVGELQMAFQQLKEKLYAQGLFDQAHKKPLPACPMRVGIVTSPAGAAVHDIIRVMRKRWPAAKLLLLPVRVRRPRRRSSGPLNTPTDTRWRTSSSWGAAAGAWRICGASMTRGWPGPSTGAASR